MDSWSPEMPGRTATPSFLQDAMGGISIFSTKRAGMKTGSVRFHRSQQVALDFFLGQRPDETIHELPVFEQKHRRDASNPILGSDKRIFIDVDFGDLDPAGILGRQFVQDRGHGLAWAAPRRPTVNQHGYGAGNDLVGKGGIGYFNGLIRTAADDQGFPALAAQGPIVDSLFGHAILRSAGKAADDHLVQGRPASAARGPILQPRSQDPILRPAVQASQDDAFLGHRVLTSKRRPGRGICGRMRSASNMATGPENVNRRKTG
jgi:hypothetical protein